MYYKQVILMLAAIAALASCEKAVVADDGATEGDERLVTLRLGGEYGYATGEEPLTRAGDGGKTLYGVSIYYGPSGQYEATDRYAYGLFDDPAKMQVVLNKAHDYRVECTVVKDGGDVVYSEDGTYFEPFLRSDDSEMELTNRFIKDYATGFKTLASGLTAIDASTTANSPMTDRYYGMSDVFSAYYTTDVTVALRRAAYGIRLVVEPPLDGSVVVTLPRRTVTVSAGDAKHDSQAIYTFADVASGSRDGHEQDVDLSLVWTRQSGTVVNDTKTLTVKRNTLTTVTLDFSASDYGHIAVSLEDTEMQTENDSWHVTD